LNEINHDPLLIRQKPEPVIKQVEPPAVNEAAKPKTAKPEVKIVPE
jgi:hypothetical protein